MKKKKRISTKAWGVICIIIAILLFFSIMMRNASYDAEFDMIDYSIGVVALGVLVAGIVLYNKRKKTPTITSTREELDKKDEAIVRVIVENVLKHFAKKHGTSLEEIATVVDCMIDTNKSLLHKIHDMEPLCLDVSDLYLIKDETCLEMMDITVSLKHAETTYFKLMDMTIHSRYVEISYEVDSVLYTEKIRR